MQNIQKTTLKSMNQKTKMNKKYKSRFETLNLKVQFIYMFFF